jgi:tetratricopeptide (TPR) repeat protein
MLALRAGQSAALRRGDLAGAMACARRARELHPYEHVGDERLGLLYGKQLEVEPALAHSLRAVSIAPFCHVAHQSRAVALFVSGDFAGAERHARRALEIEEPSEPDAGNHDLILLRALTGDVDGLERCLKKLDAEQPLSLFPRYFEVLRAKAREQAKKP